MQKKLFLLVAFFLLIGIELKAGDSLKVFRRTGIYAEIGGLGYFHKNVSVEHYFTNVKWFHLGLRGAYGKYGTWGGDGNEALLTLTTLAGGKHHFLEIQGGTILYIATSEKAINRNNGNPEYRYAPLFGIGYNFRVWHLLLKAGSTTSCPINAGVGLIF